MYQPPPPVARTTNALAIASFVLGIAAWCMLPFAGAIAAVVCGHLARGEIRRAPPGSVDGGALAAVGLVLGYVQLTLIALGIVLVVGFFMLGMGFGLHSLPWR